MPDTILGGMFPVRKTQSHILKIPAEKTRPHILKIPAGKTRPHTLKIPAGKKRPHTLKIPGRKKTSCPKECDKKSDRNRKMIEISRQNFPEIKKTKARTRSSWVLLSIKGEFIYYYIGRGAICQYLF